MEITCQRLETCFLRVFPNLTREQVRKVSVDTTAQWDSMASISLLSLVGEEFGIEIDMDDLEQFTSFDGLLGYVEAHAPRD
jgi:acyl carrier protein